MPEHRYMDPREVKPTRVRKCIPQNINALRPYYERGQHGVDQLEPAMLVRSHGLDDEEVLLYDGNHRLTLGLVYGLMVPGVIYDIGEVLRTGVDAFPVTITDIHTLQMFRRQADRKGYTSFEALARKSALLG